MEAMQKIDENFTIKYLDELLRMKLEHFGLKANVPIHHHVRCFMVAEANEIKEKDMGFAPR